jgi:ribonuclease HI
MKKLSGTSWGADHNIQKKLYLGRVRSVLEYGTAAWGTAAKTNLDKVARVQNQASRIITGALKSTPIQAMETLTGLQSLESRRDAIVLTQAAKFKRMKNHPINKRMSEPTKCRLKRSSFVHNARRLERQDPELLQQGNKQIPTHSSVPAWRRDRFPEVRETIPGILPKGTQSEPERKALALDHMEQAYPKVLWTYAYTDGSAEEATRNGGGGIFLTLKDGTHVRQAIPTGKFSTNYKAEADALQTAAETLCANREAIHPRVVIFSDALSVLQAVQNPKNKDLNPLVSALARLQQATELTIIQWIPSHCNIAGNEEADRLAKEGGQQPQEEQEISYEEVKTIIKEKQKKRWLQLHPNHNKTDAYYLLPRPDQVNIVRLRTGHSRLRHHMFTRFRIGETAVCPCGTAPMTVEHFLQDCPTHHNLRAETWPADQPMREKLCGSLESLRRTAAFVSASGVPV